VYGTRETGGPGPFIIFVARRYRWTYEKSYSILFRPRHGETKRQIPYFPPCTLLRDYKIRSEAPNARNNNNTIRYGVTIPSSACVSLRNDIGHSSLSGGERNGIQFAAVVLRYRYAERARISTISRSPLTIELYFVF